MTALLLTGTHLLAALGGAWLLLKWQGALPRDTIRVNACVGGNRLREGETHLAAADMLHLDKVSDNDIRNDNGLDDGDVRLLHRAPPAPGGFLPLSLTGSCAGKRALAILYIGAMALHRKPRNMRADQRNLRSARSEQTKHFQIVREAA